MVGNPPRRRERGDSGANFDVEGWREAARVERQCGASELRGGEWRTATIRRDERLSRLTLRLARETRVVSTHRAKVDAGTGQRCVVDKPVRLPKLRERHQRRILGQERLTC